MSEVTKYEAQKKKLDGLCEEHDLVYRFQKDRYPILLTLRPIQGAGVQLSMLEETDGENHISANASMTLIFADGEITPKIEGGTFTIPDVLYTKIKNIFKKMVSYWQQFFFMAVIQSGSLRKGAMPVIDESDEGVDDEVDDGFEEVDSSDTDDQGDPDEDQITAATQLVRYENKASIRLLAQRLHIGLSKAGRLMDVLEQRGVVGAIIEGGKREVLPADVPED